MNETVAKEALRLEESLLYTFKQHYEAEQLWLKGHYSLGIPAAGLSAIAGTTAMSGLPDYVTASTGILAAFFAAAMTMTHPERKSQAHREAGRLHQELYEQIRRWSTVDLPGQSSKVARLFLEKVASAKADLATSSPGLPRIVYQRVKRGIEAGEAEFGRDRAEQAYAPR